MARFARLSSLIESADTTLVRGPANFLTITVLKGRQGNSREETVSTSAAKPGDIDPYVIATLESEALERFLQNDDPADKAYLADVARAFEDGSIRLHTGDPEAPPTQLWYEEKVSFADDNIADPLQKPDGIAMSYDCSDNFGAPDVGDSQTLSYSNLGGTDPDETILVGGNSKKTWNFVSGTCATSLTSDAPTGSTVTWAQIRAAFESLTSSCLDHPLKKSSGGKAFKGDSPQTIRSWIRRYVDFIKLSGRKGRRGVDGKALLEKREDVNGANALPANLTMYVWKHQWNFGCEENAVKQGKDVSTCATA